MKMYVPKFTGKSKQIIRIVALLLPVLLLLPILTRPAFAQTTYVITDGDQIKVHTTFETNPEEVLDEAGFTLGEDDMYTTQAGDGVSEITVQRKQTITIQNCGETVVASSYGETLDSLFTRLGIPAYGSYKVSMAMETMTYDGMEVRVDRFQDVEETYTQEIPYETTYCYDPNLPEGQEKVVQAGKVGQMQTKANVVYKNSQELSRTILDQTVVEQPANAIVAKGTGTGEKAKGNAPAIGDGVIVTADGQVLTYSQTGQFVATAYTHTDAGCDLITATGTTVHMGTVAVDPKVIPYGTRMFIVCNDGSYIYGISTAEDCGGAIKNNRLDLYFPTTSECFQFGVRDCTVYFLD